MSDQHTPDPERHDRTLGPEDILPIELDDGTRMTCTSIAGGQESTDGVPNFLYLTISKNGEAVGRYRFVSMTELTREMRALGLDLEPGDLDRIARLLRQAIKDDPDPEVGDVAAYERMLALIERLIGHQENVQRSQVPPRSLFEMAHERLEQAVRSLVVGGLTDNDYDAELHTIAFYIIAEHLRVIGKHTSPTSSALAGLGRGIGQMFGARAMYGGIFDRGGDVGRATAPPGKERKKPKPARRSKAKRR